MSDRIENLLLNHEENCIFPFFWLRGEDEETLREYMRVIDEIGIKAVCVESRPHPDFCGPGWWKDMDIILDEAKKRDMKIWILDDSHFPTGYANGALEGQPDEMCRQSICCRIYECAADSVLRIEEETLFHPDPFVPNQIEEYIGEKNPRMFDDDTLLALYAVSKSGKKIDLLPMISENSLNWQVPEGEWKVYALHLSRNMGYHRSYINMMSAPSCRLLLDAVYEPHYSHYKEEFGKTIAGFFSDEPELGNGHLYDGMAVMGKNMDYPWSNEVQEEIQKKLGENYADKMYLLWENEADESEKAKIRYAYMDAVTRLVKKDFSTQIGKWCRDRGVQYIGHMIEDNNQHARTGSSLGHYFRGLAGQDMAGIDDIGGQVFPQGEDVNVTGQMIGDRIGEFYHYMLAKLASSAAAIEPGKKGNSMCEIFGNYGWSEGVRLEKYLVDHFMVRGINHFVPHAFSAAPYPDPDCPPHFYAHGNNPQYRHFGKLMTYTNRICNLISGGYHVAPAAVLYHGEGEWTGGYMESHKPGRLLYDAQIDYDIIPQEVFEQREIYGTEIMDNTLQVNTQKYRVLLIPEQQFVTKALALAVEELCENGVKVAFIDAYPQGICDAQYQEELISKVKRADLIRLEDVVKTVKEGILADSLDVSKPTGSPDVPSGAVKDVCAPLVSICPSNDRIRCYHYEHIDGIGVLFLVNEGSRTYQGNLYFEDSRDCYEYDAWDNKVNSVIRTDNQIALKLMPQESKVFILDSDAAGIKKYFAEPVIGDKNGTVSFAGEWKRSICRSIEYPKFGQQKTVILPDGLCEEEPYFSGYVRYENTFEACEGRKYMLEITDAYEGVEVFVNGKSLGIKVVPVFQYDLTEAVHAGKNELVIEVATTLERENAKNPGPYGMPAEATSKSGITGEVTLYYIDTGNVILN